MLFKSTELLRGIIKRKYWCDPPDHNGKYTVTGNYSKTCYTLLLFSKVYNNSGSS